MNEIYLKFLHLQITILFLKYKQLIFREGFIGKVFTGVKRPGI